MTFIHRNDIQNLISSDILSLTKSNILIYFSYNILYKTFLAHIYYKALGWRKKQPIASVSDVDVLRKVL